MSINEIQLAQDIFMIIIGLIIVFWLIGTAINIFKGNTKEKEKKSGKHWRDLHKAQDNLFWAHIAEQAEKDDKEHGGGAWK